MRVWLREAFVTALAGILLGGPAAALWLTLAPPSLRTRAASWTILASCLALVVVLRRRRWKQR
jgi:hypothetical protein